MKFIQYKLGKDLNKILLFLENSQNLKIIEPFFLIEVLLYDIKKIIYSIIYFPLMNFICVFIVFMLKNTDNYLLKTR